MWQLGMTTFSVAIAASFVICKLQFSAARAPTDLEIANYQLQIINRGVEFYPHAHA